MASRTYRRIIRSPESRPQGYLVALGALGISTLLFLSTITPSDIWLLAKIKALFNIVSLVLIIGSGIATHYLWKQRERISTLNMPKMTHRSYAIAQGIKRLVNDKQITDVLKLSNTTRYGEEMPEIEVWVNDNQTEGYIAIENIANYDRADREKFEQRLSGILAGEYQRFAVVTSELTAGDSFIIFYFEDTLTSQRLYVNNQNDLARCVSERTHDIQLSKDLIWHTDITPHLAIIARTRSGKSVFAGRYLARLMLLQGWIVEYHSAKLDRYVNEFKGHSEPLAIIERAEYWCSIMDERLSDINKAGKEKASDMPNMPNIGLFFDELGNLNAALESLDKTDKTLKVGTRWTNAINRLTATGASAGIHIIAISQFATKEGFLPSLARVNCSDAVIMLGGAADSAEERKYLMSGFADMSKRSYRQGQGVARIMGAGKKWEVPHYYETPWFDNY